MTKSSRCQTLNTFTKVINHAYPKVGKSGTPRPKMMNDDYPENKVRINVYV